MPGRHVHHLSRLAIMFSHSCPILVIIGHDGFAIVSLWSGTILAVQEPYLSQGNRSAVVRTFFGQARCSEIWQHDGGMEIAQNLNVLMELRSNYRILYASDVC